MAKMKSVQSTPNNQTTVGLTSRMQLPALVTLISFLNAMCSNFLNGFFMRPLLKMRPVSINLLFFISRQQENAIQAAIKYFLLSLRQLPCYLIFVLMPTSLFGLIRNLALQIIFLQEYISGNA